jgi:selenocysteine lyase/cysteine desulfurase
MHKTPALLPERRQFIKHAISGSLAALAVPALVANPIKSQPSTTPCPSLFLADPAEERYWEMVKKQFPIKEELMMVNAANLCPSPYFVHELVKTSLEALEQDVSFQYRAIFEKERKDALTKLASFLGTSEKEIGITRNTSESNNLIVHGLDLRKGDEVVLWEQNHPTNGNAWEEQAKRLGFEVKWIKMSTNPKNKEDLITPFAEAITKNTRLLSFSHISNVSGLALPAKEICDLARSNGILSMVDGAQSFGFLNLDLQEMGCDFYTSSTHKWLMGPLENGLIYMKEENMDRVWPSVIGAGWKADFDSVDARYCHLGQRNETTCSAIPAILDFHTEIGRKQVEERIYHINTYLKNRIEEDISNARFITPRDETLSGGVTIIEIPEKDPVQLFSHLYEREGIACAPTGGLRFSPHIYNTIADMDRIVEAVKNLA